MHLPLTFPSFHCSTKERFLDSLCWTFFLGVGDWSRIRVVTFLAIWDKKRGLRKIPGVDHPRVCFIHDSWKHAWKLDWGILISKNLNAWTKNYRVCSSPRHVCFTWRILHHEPWEIANGLIISIRNSGSHVSKICKGVDRSSNARDSTLLSTQTSLASGWHRSTLMIARYLPMRHDFKNHWPLVTCSMWYHDSIPSIRNPYRGGELSSSHGWQIEIHSRQNRGLFTLRPVKERNHEALESRLAILEVHV